MRTRAILFLIAAVTGCRAGFDPMAAGAAAPDAQPDAPPDMTPVEPPAMIACSESPQFAVTGAITQLSATATEHGYRVFMVDGDGNLLGAAYDFASGHLAQGSSPMMLASNATGPLGVATSGDRVLVAMQYGRPDATGTALLAFDGALAAVGTPAMQDGWLGAGSAFAPTPSGDLAFIAQSKDSGEIDATVVSKTGEPQGGVHPVIDSSEVANRPTIVPSSTGFTVAWGALAPTPDQVRAELLDDQLGLTSPEPVIITSEQQTDSFAPAVAYLASADRYLIAWTQKISGDEIWYSLRNSDLTEATKPFRIATQGISPAVVAGRDDFLLVWQTGDHLGAARVSRDGAPVLHGIRSITGVAAAWNVVVRNGAPALVWVETGGTSPTLWFDPLCN